MMEDICDNLFNPDPYYQQGGEWCESAAWTILCTEVKRWAIAFGPDARQRQGRSRPVRPQGGRLGLGQSAGGQAGDATCSPAYLRRREETRPKKLNKVALKEVGGNPGLLRLRKTAVRAFSHRAVRGLPPSSADRRCRGRPWRRTRRAAAPIIRTSRSPSIASRCSSPTTTPKKRR